MLPRRAHPPLAFGLHRYSGEGTAGVGSQTGFNTAEAKDALFQQGVDAEVSTPEVLGARIRDEIVKWREVIGKAGIQPE